MTESKPLSITATRLRVFSLMVLTVLSQQSFAFPVFVEAQKFSRFFGVNRSHLIAISVSKDVKKRIPLQIDEVEDGAALVLRTPSEIRPLRESLAHPKKNDPFYGRLQSVHRLVLDDRDFSVCEAECLPSVTEAAKVLCSNPIAHVLFKVSLPSERKDAFIVDCGTSQKELPKRDSIAYDTKSLTVTTPHYAYQHVSEKNIFFRSITPTQREKPIVSKSEVKALLKPKFLFNMKFKDDDLISQITSVTRGPQSLSFEVAMALNLLAMKINNQICCDVSFYEDALYFPVVLDLPFSGSSFASGSGVFFGFETNQSEPVQTEFIPANSPDDSDAIVIKQNQNLLVIGMRRSTSQGSNATRPKIVTGKDMAKAEFMPVKSDNGIFYDIKETQQGFHHFNVWLFFGAEQDKNKLVGYAQRGPQAVTEYSVR